MTAPAKCTWTEDHNGVWETSCGKAWEFYVHGPDENGFRVCPFCGNALLERAFKEGR